jgi:threonine aldolase
MIDLRSDTVTRPSPEMRKAMAYAEVGDDVFSEDPSVNELEAEVAALLGKEAALFTPSGCMANQLALKVHCREGDEVILEADAHIFNYETTAASYLSRVQLYPVKAQNKGRLAPEEVEGAVREKAYYMPVSRLLALENSHNRAGGTVHTVEQVEALAQTARKHQMSYHLDGARLWNACAHLGAQPIDFAQHFDTVAVCFSKGLGAPVGSALTGPRDLIQMARRHRKIWGGGMRQAGILAAGALYALRNNRERLIEDQEKARSFATIIVEGTSKVAIDMERVQTNIVLMQVSDGVDLQALSAALKQEGVAVSMGARGMLRAVTHLDVTMEECKKAAQIIVTYLNKQ